VPRLFADPSVKQPSAAARILGGAGYAVTLARLRGAFSVPRPHRGDGAPSGAPVFRLAASSFERCGRLSALHGGVYFGPGPRFLPKPCGCGRQRAPRTRVIVPRGAGSRRRPGRGRYVSPRPQAPHPTPPS